MILPMDVIIASEDAKFGMVFVKMGVTPELASSHFLVQRVGFGAASEMCLTARLYSGKEAFEMGLADRLVPAADLLRDAKAMARTMAANPSRHLRWVKQLLSPTVRNGHRQGAAAGSRSVGQGLRFGRAQGGRKRLSGKATAGVQALARRTVSRGRVLAVPEQLLTQAHCDGTVRLRQRNTALMPTKWRVLRWQQE